MKCPADVVILKDLAAACDSEPECDGCGFCFYHCVCGGISEPEPPKGGREGDEK